MGISNSLPKTGYMKMIDIWMIFTMSYPFIVITLHCFQQVCIIICILKYLNFEITSLGRCLEMENLWENKLHAQMKIEFFGEFWNPPIWGCTIVLMLMVKFYIEIKIYSRSFGTAASKYLLWPVLPICGIIFTLIFFSIGIYVYKFQDMQHSALCI